MNIICPIVQYLVRQWMKKQDFRITHVQQTSREEQERSFNIEIYKDVVFFLLLVLLRRGLINWLNSVA